VVRDCHLKSIGRIARETRQLIEKARNRRLRPDDLEGGTFTISNLGMYPVVEFSAIINPPQAGILAIARPQERPVADRGRVVFRQLMNATLSADHRAVDGVTGAVFLQAFKEVLESPERLML
jgi:pyruvate dehydrogenase E2 component (dihydrolipoamide acetyltransferase)